MEAQYYEHRQVISINESLEIECFQAGLCFTGKKLPILFDLPSGTTIRVRGSGSEEAAAFVKGWKAGRTV
jgi:hypothetical protein